MPRVSPFATPARIPTVREEIALVREKIAELERQVGAVGDNLRGTYWHTSRVRELASCRVWLSRLEERAAAERQPADRQAVVLSAMERARESMRQRVEDAERAGRTDLAASLRRTLAWMADLEKKAAEERLEA